MWVFFIGLKAQRQTGVLLLAGGRALAQGVWLRSQPGLMGSAWIGTEQVSNQLQAIVDSNRLAERDRTAADINNRTASILSDRPVRGGLFQHHPQGLEGHHPKG